MAARKLDLPEPAEPMMEMKVISFSSRTRGMMRWQLGQARAWQTMPRASMA